MNKSSPKVTVVLPTYNGAKCIRQSIDSCLNQTYKNIELIIVDDGSTDKTPKIIKSYKDKSIKYVRHEKNKGLPHALNTGFANSTGEYLTWISDDNQFLPNAIEEMANCFAENEDVDLVYADYWAYYQETGKKELRKMPDKLNLKKENDVGACFLYTRRAYKNVGDYDPRYELVEDYDYWIRICKRFNSIHHPHPLYIYTEHSKSLKSTRHHSILLFNSILKYQNKYFPLSELRESILRFIFDFIGNLSSPKKKKEAAVLYFRDILKISRISLSLCLLCISLLIYYSGLKILKFFMRHFLFVLRYSLEYIDFFFSFKQKCSRLKISKDKKDVLCIVPYMVVGGAERVILNIAKGTNREKFNFHIVTTSSANNVWYNKFKSYFQNIVIPMKRIKNIYYKYFHQLIKKLNIDIVLISNSGIGYEYLPLLKSKFKHVRTVDVLHSEKSTGAADGLEWITPYLDRRICISNHLKEYMVKKYKNSGVKDRYIKRLNVVHNCIDIREYSPNVRVKGKFKSQFGIPDDVKIISFIGRFVSEKNPVLFVDIARNVLARLPNYKLKFVMAGDGPEFDKVRNTLNKYGIKDYFTLTGMIDNVVELLADTYILLVVSKREGIPFVILEAMAMGVPVISTDVGAINEVIKNNINGYLIDIETNVVESFTCKILDLLTGKSNHRALAKKTRETMLSKFSLETMGAKYQSIFNELAEDYD